MICTWCQTPIPQGDDYQLSPKEEPVHVGECHTEAWNDVDADPADLDPDDVEVGHPDEAEQYLEPGAVAANFRRYVDALESEIEMAEAAIHQLEDGRLASRDLVEELPTPTPLEAWQADRWDELGDEYVALELMADADPDRDVDGGRDG
jgi:hypothetical protein